MVRISKRAQTGARITELILDMDNIFMFQREQEAEAEAEAVAIGRLIQRRDAFASQWLNASNVAAAAFQSSTETRLG